MRPKHINAINGQILKQGLCGVFDIRGTIINPFHFLVCILYVHRNGCNPYKHIFENLLESLKIYVKTLIQLHLHFFTIILLETFQPLELDHTNFKLASF